MSPQEEMTGRRDRTYSAWHRRLSTRRFVGIENAQLLAMIDLDSALFIEYDERTKEPLALIETAADYGQSYKSATVTKNLARRCSPYMPAYVLLYEKSLSNNPADTRCKDISSFRVRRLWKEPETAWEKLTPEHWAQALLALRQDAAQGIDRFLDFAAKTRLAEIEPVPAVKQIDLGFMFHQGNGKHNGDH